jgi:hypothetical protein
MGHHVCFGKMVGCYRKTEGRGAFFREKVALHRTWIDASTTFNETFSSEEVGSA